MKKVLVGLVVFGVIVFSLQTVFAHCGGCPGDSKNVSLVSAEKAVKASTCASKKKAATCAKKKASCTKSKAACAKSKAACSKKGADCCPILKSLDLSKEQQQKFEDFKKGCEGKFMAALETILTPEQLVKFKAEKAKADAKPAIAKAKASCSTKKSEDCCPILKSLDLSKEQQQKLEDLKKGCKGKFMAVVEETLTPEQLVKFKAEKAKADAEAAKAEVKEAPAAE